MNIFKKLYLSVVFKYNTVCDNRLLSKLLRGVSEDDKPFFETPLKNELKYINSMSMHQSSHQKDREQKEFYMQITKLVLERLLVLKNIIGIQPMQGPVGLVYLLRYLGAADSNRARLEIIKETVTSGTRKLHAGWSVEAAQDLRSVHGIDLMTELQSLLSGEVANELIAEVIDNLRNLGTDDQQPSITSHHGIMIAISKAANHIASKTRRGAGNFVITSPIGISLLQNDKNVKFVASAPKKEMEVMSLAHAGDVMVDDSILYPVYVSLAVKEETPTQVTFIVGYKGKSGECDTGYVYSPYVPIITAGPVINPQTFAPMITLMTRYGKTSLKASNDSPVDASAYYRTVVYDAALESIE